MADRRREAWALALGEELQAEIVWDEKRDVWDTRRRALLAGTGSHVCVIQDDAILSEGFLESVNRLVEFSGDHPVGLWARSPAAEAAVELGVKSWWSGDGPNWNVASIFPSAHVPDLIAYGDSRRLAYDDPRIRLFYLNVAKTDCWYTLPSLVDHRPGSLISPRAKDRHATIFGSGVGVDWSIPPTRMDKGNVNPVVTLFKDGQERRVRRRSKTYRRMLELGWK